MVSETENQDTFGVELPDYVEDCVEALDLLQAEIDSITDQLNHLSDGSNKKLVKAAISAKHIKRKQQAVLRGHLSFLKDERRKEEHYHVITTVMNHIKLLHGDIYGEISNVIREAQKEARSAYQ